MNAIEPYRQREGPLRDETVWSVEDGALVRHRAGREARWALADLSRFTLMRRPNRWGADLRVAQLKFGRRTAAISSQGWRGVGRPEDRTGEFAGFVRALAAESAAHAPAARFDSQGPALMAGDGLWWIVALLGAGALAMAAMGFSTGMWRIGLGWSARLLFAVLLLVAAAPWLRRAERRFDPLAPPEDLTGR